MKKEEKIQKTQLLCTFTKREKLQETLDQIKNTYDVTFSRIYVLENKENKRELLCTYNINMGDSQVKILPNTISIHRKKQTNTLYTINALNEIVALRNDGRTDPNFEVDWTNYQNMLLVTDDNGLKKIKTKIYDIVEID